MDNKHDLPEIVLKIIEHAQNNYSSGHADYTPSSLIRPPQQSVLIKQYEEELTHDASGALASLLGTAFHDFAEGAVEGDKDYIVEKRFYREIDGYMIGGQIDLYHRPKRHLMDYKVTSIYKALKGADEDWVLQNSINKWIMKENGHDVKEASNIIFCKDWRKGESMIKPGYPPTPIVLIPIPLMSDEEVEAFIRGRIAEIKQGDNVRECTPEERWADDAKYAVMKFGGKRAVKLFDSEEAAEKYMDETGNGDMIEERRGDAWRRCKDYCPVLNHCKQFKEGYHGS